MSPSTSSTCALSDEEHLFGICPFFTAQKVLSGKWSMYILHLLCEGPMRFNELLRQMPQPMTHATLSRQLKALEQHRLIVRHDFAEIPPRVEYSLSPIGERFRSVMDPLADWGQEYIAYIKHGDGCVA